MADSFSLEKKYADKMIDHGRREAPSECCGILAGVNGRIIKIYQTTNAAHSLARYRVDSHKRCSPSTKKFGRMAGRFWVFIIRILKPPHIHLRQTSNPRFYPDRSISLCL